MVDATTFSGFLNSIDVKRWSPICIRGNEWERKFSVKRKLHTLVYEHRMCQDLAFCVLISNNTTEQKWIQWCHICRVAVAERFWMGDKSVNEIVEKYGNVMGTKQVLRLICILRKFERGDVGKKIVFCG